MYCFDDSLTSRIILKSVTFIFLLKVYGNRATIVSSSFAMYSFNKECKDKINTTAFSFVMFKVAGSYFKTPGRSSDFKTLSSLSSIEAAEAMNISKIASFDSQALRHSSITVKFTLLNSIININLIINRTQHA